MIGVFLAIALAPLLIAILELMIYILGSLLLDDVPATYKSRKALAEEEALKREQAELEEI
jgi:hypothetical protein